MAAAVADFVQQELCTGYPGPKVATAERQIAALAGRSMAIATCSGTAALELALRSAGIHSGDIVLLSAYDYPGNFRCVEATGAIPRAVDVMPGRWDLSVTAIEKQLAPNVRAIVASHLHGLTPDLIALSSLSSQRGLLLIEDACQGIGGSLAGVACGGLADVSIFSFGGSKLVTTGNGGAILTDNPRLAQKVRTWNERPGPTFSLSEIAAVMIPPQINVLAAAHQRRRLAVRRLREVIDRISGWKLPELLDRDDDAADYKFAWMVPPELRNDLLERAANQGLPLGAGFNVFRRIAVDGAEQAMAIARSIVLLDHRAFSGNEASLNELLQRIERLGAC